jgi:hypothetical protein
MQKLSLEAQARELLAQATSSPGGLVALADSAVLLSVAKHR